MFGSIKRIVRGREVGEVIVGMITGAIKENLDKIQFYVFKKTSTDTFALKLIEFLRFFLL